MTDKGSKKPANKLEEVTELDDIEVPTTNVYTRTGKAAPTEVLPSTPKPAEAERQKRDDDSRATNTAPAANKAPKAKPIDIDVERIDEPAASTAAKTEAPAAASTVSTAGTLHTTETTEATEGLDAGAAVGTGTIAAGTAGASSADAPQPPVGRGTIDVGLLILRLILGAVLIITSLGILFQLGGNAGLAGLEEQLADYNYPRALAIALPTMGLASGVFLVLGLLTPIAAMVAVAATGFGAIHAVDVAENASNVFAWEPSIWLAISLLGMALTVQFTGPGVFGVDFSRSWTRRPMASSWICAALGIAAAVVMWWFA